MIPLRDPSTFDGPVEYAATFSPDPAAVGAARQFVRSSLARHAVSSFTTELIVSELVGNVVRHAGTDFMVSVSLGAMIRVSVLDDCAAIPAVRHADAEDEGGRGLLIVDSLASTWGVTPTRSGKSVWAEVDSAALAQVA